MSRFTVCRLKRDISAIYPQVSRRSSGNWSIQVFTYPPNVSATISVLVSTVSGKAIISDPPG